MSDIPALDKVERSIVRWLADRLENNQLSIMGPDLGDRLKAEGAGDRFTPVFKHLEALGILEPRYNSGPHSENAINAFVAQRLGRIVIPLTWNIAYRAIELRDAMQAEGGKRKGKRGNKPDPDIDPAKDRRLCADWQAAKRERQSREGFCRARGISVSHLIAAQDRERYRRRRDAE